MLILLNGPPASGKSTLAARLAEHYPPMVNLDIDVIRSSLDEWPSDPHAAGLAARRLAVTEARTHLQAGRAVVVPQFLGRLDFIEELEALAAALGVSFVEVALQIDRETAISAFERRTKESLDPVHLDAALLVQRSDSGDPLGEMFDALECVVVQRPNTRRVRVLREDIDRTFNSLVKTLAL